MVRVRDAIPADAAAIGAIGRLAFEATYGELIDPVTVRAGASHRYSEDAIGRLIRDCGQRPGSHLLVAERDGVVVGFLHYDDNGANPELHQLYLAPEEVGQGTGSALMDGLEDRLGPGAAYILVVAEANEGAVAFYERRGFRRIGRLMGIAHYAGRGITFPAGSGDFACIVMRSPFRE